MTGSCVGAGDATAEVLLAVFGVVSVDSFMVSSLRLMCAISRACSPFGRVPRLLRPRIKSGIGRPQGQGRTLGLQFDAARLGIYLVVARALST